MKVIVIDDENDALSNFLVSVVDNDGLEYKMFKSDPLSALDYLRKNNVAAAFLDINMPEINGIDLAEKLIQIKETIAVVFISGYTQDEKAIKQRLGNNLKGFCYKPYSIETLTGFIKQIAIEAGETQVARIKTFGGFDVILEHTPIKFTSTKSKELLALLVDKNGISVTMGEAISFLWPEKNADHSKILYRDAVWRLRQTLSDYGLSRLVTFSRAQLVLNINYAQCDYWDFLNGINTQLYSGAYLPGYDWSVETQNRLDILSENKK